MENLEINGTRETYFIPYVSFNAETGVCEISGESYLEDAYEFYQKLLKWMDDFYKETGKPIHLKFKYTYFNTSSSRAILEMLHGLKKIIDSGAKINVDWFFTQPDYDEMQLEGEDMKIESGIEINLIEIQGQEA